MDGIVISRVSETRKGRMALFCEEGFLFSLDEETFHFNPVQEGDLLTADRLEELRRTSDTRKAKEKALNYLSLRPYGSRELYDKLCQKYDEHSAAAAVARMQELGMIDDEAFARQKAAWLKSRKKSRREILRQLQEKGVERSLAESVLEELFCEGDEIETLNTLIARSYASKLAAGKRDNVYAALCRRGFAPSLVRQVLADWQSEQEEENTSELEWEP